MHIKKRHIVVVVACLLLLVYLFRGPLFPWSPIKPGYTKIKTTMVTLFFRNLGAKDSAVYRIDEIIREAESFHQLEYQHSFRILVLDEESDMKRYLPWMKGSGFSASLSLVNLIYIGPTARRYPDGIASYLKHELSHLLIDQNTNFQHARSIRAQGWLAEGTAEYFSGHRFYSKKTFVDLYRNGKFDFIHDFEKDPMEMSAGELRLRYTYYKLFISFLVDIYGLQKFQLFLGKYIEDPEAYKKIFTEIYAVKPEELLERFESGVLN